MKNIFKTVIIWLVFMAAYSCTESNPESPQTTISKTELLNKIKGGWAGQVIGCTYGGPTEFIWNGTMIDDHISIPWDDTRMLWYFQNFPGLYDDVYMDLTFVDVFRKYGIRSEEHT